MAGKEAEGNLEVDDDSDIEVEYLNAAYAKKFRALAARLNHVACERPDLQYSVKECARHMARPQAGSWAPLKKIGRYLLYRPRLVLEYKVQAQPRCISVYSDSDWAGCARARCSTSGGSVLLGSHLIKSWYRQQQVTALSSAEAETYARVRASCA